MKGRNVELTFTHAELCRVMTWVIQERFLSITNRQPVTVTEVRTSDEPDALVTVVFALGTPHKSTPVQHDTLAQTRTLISDEQAPSRITALKGEVSRRS